MTAHQVQEQRKETERQEPEDGYFGRNSNGSYCYESAPERGGEVPTQDFVEMDKIIHKTSNVTREYSHRMFCIVDLLNNKKIELKQIDLDNGFISFMSCNLFYDLLLDECLFGKLFNCLDINRIPHSYDLVDILTKKRKNKFSKEMHSKYWNTHSYLTADFPLYVVEKGKTILYLAKRENNPLFSNVNNLRDALFQLSRTEFYKPTEEDVEKVINADSTLRIPLSELWLEGYDTPLSSSVKPDKKGNFTINLLDLKNLNNIEVEFVKRIYNQGKNIDEEVQSILCSCATWEWGKAKTTIEILHPVYNQFKAVSRLSVLRYENEKLSISVADCDIDNKYNDVLLITL